MNAAAEPLPARRPQNAVAERHAFAAEFAALAKDFRLRHPALPSRLMGPYRGYGLCLSGLLEPGDVTWFDDELPADDGDIVLVELHQKTLELIVERNRDRPGWLEMYGEQPPRTCVKILRHVNGEHWLQDRETAFPLAPSKTIYGRLPSHKWGGDNVILGTLRHARRGDTPLFGSPELTVATGITAGAATEVTSIADSGPITLSHISGSGFVSGMILYVALDTAADDFVEVSAHFRHGVNGLSPNTGWTSNVFAVGANTSGSWGSNASQPITRTDNVYTQYAVVGTFALGAGSWWFGIGANIDRGTAGAGQIDSVFRDVEIQVTRVRR